MNGILSNLDSIFYTVLNTFCWWQKEKGVYRHDKKSKVVEMTIKQELEAIAENINDVLDDISKLIRVKMDNKEIDDFRKLKAIYDKLKITM